MITEIDPISCTLLVDTEGACVPCKKESLKLRQCILRRSNTPFSEMKAGKFRKLFDRHALAFRH